MKSMVLKKLPAKNNNKSKKQFLIELIYEIVFLVQKNKYTKKNKFKPLRGALQNSVSSNTESSVPFSFQ